MANMTLFEIVEAPKLISCEIFWSLTLLSMHWWELGGRGFESCSRGEIFFFHFYVDMQFIAPSSGTNKHYECISSLLHSKTLLKIAFF